MVAFDEVTMEWSIVCHIRMDKQELILYVLEVGETLVGVVVDWSDAEILGLGLAVGKDLATNLKYTGPNHGRE